MASHSRRLAPSSMASKMICVPLRCMSATAWSKLGAANDTVYGSTGEALELRPFSMKSPAWLDSAMS